ncbi:MAG: RluA family pseudouridine synthase [Pseudomonadales bacterium]
MTSDRLERHLVVTQENVRALDLLAEESGLSRQRLKMAMTAGAVWISRGGKTRRLRRATGQLNSGDELHLYYDQEIVTAEVPEPGLVADEQAYTVWDKPYGLYSQGSKWGDRSTVARWAEQHLLPQRPAFIVHRLDRAAQGLILVAHSKKAVVSLTALFQQRALEKIYRVIVCGKYSEHEQTLTAELDGKHSVSHAKILDYSPDLNRSLLEVRIDTGRKHQIRRHLSGAGFPVVGDRLYGNDGGLEDLQLRATQLSFTCPLSGLPRDYHLPPARLLGL